MGPSLSMLGLWAACSCAGLSSHAMALALSYPANAVSLHVSTTSDSYLSTPPSVTIPEACGEGV